MSGLRSVIESCATPAHFFFWPLAFDIVFPLPIGGANVTIRWPGDGPPVAQDKTDAAGNYKVAFPQDTLKIFSNGKTLIKPGTREQRVDFIMQVSANGYATDEIAGTDLTADGIITLLRSPEEIDGKILLKTKFTFPAGKANRVLTSDTVAQQSAARSAPDQPTTATASSSWTLGQKLSVLNSFITGGVGAQRGSTAYAESPK